ncbi:hypothetical protein JOE44_003215 [Chryseobacterium sp. PvR013]|nr:hypothetical protein [Chryseobacterium sp. PvR013]
MKSKLNRISLFWKIWICHIFIYFPIRALFFLFQLDETPDFTQIVKSILISPFAGIYGLFDKFPLVILLQMLVMFFINAVISSKKILPYLLITFATHILFYAFDIYDMDYFKPFLYSFFIFLPIFLFIFRKNLKN